MKIYTKTGDAGKTLLIGGTKVAKHHIRVEAYGMVDELNVAIGMLADHDIELKFKIILRKIQNELFIIGSHLAADPKKNKMKLPDIEEEQIIFLEHHIDEWQSELPELKNFILPGGHLIVSACHLARVVCRRAERSATLVAESDMVSPVILKYLNRLSDFLFVLSRKLAQELGSEEIPWIPQAR